MAGGKIAFNDQTALADYAAVTGFDPSDPSDESRRLRRRRVPRVIDRDDAMTDPLPPEAGGDRVRRPHSDLLRRQWRRLAATAIGQPLHLLTGAQSAALTAAGLLSVLVFPLGAAALMRGDMNRRSTDRRNLLPAIRHLRFADRLTDFLTPAEGAGHA